MTPYGNFFFFHKKELENNSIKKFPHSKISLRVNNFWACSCKHSLIELSRLARLSWLEVKCIYMSAFPSLAKSSSLLFPFNSLNYLFIDFPVHFAFKKLLEEVERVPRTLPYDFSNVNCSLLAKIYSKKERGK